MKNKKILSISCIILITIIIIISIVIITHNKRSKNYEIYKVNEYNYFVYKNNEQYGVIDNKGNVIINAEYDNVKIPNPEKALFVCYEGDNTKVLNEKTEQILLEYEDIEPLRLKNISSDLIYEKTILKYKKNEKYGLVNLDGKKIVNPIYEEIDTLKLKEGELLAKKDGKYGVININGAIIVEFKYDKIEVDGYYTNENLYKEAGYIVSNTTEEGYRFGYVNKEGKKIVDTTYNDLKRINEIKDENVYLICANNGKYGLIKDGQKIIQNNYQSITYSNDILIVQNGKKYGAMSLKGHDIIGTKYDQIDITGDYLYATDSDGNLKVYNKQGEQQDFDANTQFLNIENKDYKIIIKSDDKKTTYGVFENESVTTSEEFNYIEYLFNDYFIACNQNGILGIIDDKGKIIVDFEYNTIQKIGNTNIVQASNSSKNLTDIFSEKMEKVYSIKDAVIKTFEDIIKVYNKDEIKYLSNNGEILKSSEALKDRKIFAKKQGEYWGFENDNGEVVVDNKYDKVTEINKYGFAGIQKDGKWGVINNEGEIIIEPTYEINLTDEPDFIGKYYQVQYGYGEYFYTAE